MLYSNGPGFGWTPVLRNWQWIFRFIMQEDDYRSINLGSVSLFVTCEISFQTEISKARVIYSTVELGDGFIDYLCL